MGKRYGITVGEAGKMIQGFAEERFSIRDKNQPIAFSAIDWFSLHGILLIWTIANNNNKK